MKEDDSAATLQRKFNQSSTMTVEMAEGQTSPGDYVSRLEKNQSQHYPEQTYPRHMSSQLSRPSSREVTGFSSQIRQRQDNISIFDS